MPLSPLPGDPDLESKARGHVERAFVEAEADMHARHKEFAEIYDNYMGEVSDQHKERFQLESQIMVPITLKTTESIVPRIVDAVLGPEQSFEYRPEEESDQEAASKNQGLTEHQLRQAKYRKSFTESARDQTLYGTGILKWAWVKRRGYVRRIPGSEENRKEEWTLWDGPCIRAVPIQHFFLSPLATDIESSTYCIHRTYASSAQIRSLGLAGIYGRDAALEAAKQEPTAATTALDQLTLAQRGIYQQTTFPSTTLKGLNVHEILEYWGLFSWAEDEPEVESVLTIVDRKHLLRLIPNPYDNLRRPFVAMHFIPKSGEFWGLGVGRIVRDLQIAANAIQNIRFDNVLGIIQRMWKMDTRFGPEIDVLTPRAFGVVPLDDINALQPLEMPDVTQSAFTELAMIDQMAMEATSATRPITGEFGTKRQTATEVTSTVQEAGTRLSTPIESAEMAHTEICDRVHDLNQQYMTQEKAVRILGSRGLRWTKITPAEIGKNLDAYAIGSRSPTSRAVRALQLTQFLQQAVAVEQVRIAQAQAQLALPNYKPLIDFATISRKIWESQGLSGVQDVVLSTPDDEPPMDPKAEHLLIGSGQRVLPKKTEDFMEHIQEHLSFLEGDAFARWGETEKELLQEHLELTVQMMGKVGAPQRPQPQQGMESAMPGATEGVMNPRASTVGGTSNGAETSLFTR